MSVQKDKLWCRLDEVHRKALNYVRLRQNGTIKSVKTPWPSVNKITPNGFEWNTIITIAGRSGSGKTTILNEFTRKAFDLNPTENMAVLDFQFEMTQEATGIREFTSITGTPYRDMLSADRPLDDATLSKITNHVTSQTTRDIYQVDIALSVNGIKRTVEDFCKDHPTKKVIVTMDHSLLIQNSDGEKDKFDMLYKLGEMMTELKKRLPVMFIVLTQMNRSIEEDARKKPGSTGNYPTSADVFGADALLQHSDVLIAISVPSLMHIHVYGPLRHEIKSDTLILHFLKMRNGEPSMVFFRKEFEKQRLIEIPEPVRITGPNGGGAPIPASFI